MAAPAKFNPATFTNKNWDSGILAALDTELSSLESIINTIIDNVNVIQRDDTKLANSSVHKQALATETLALFVSTWNPKGDWAAATDYKQLDVVTESGKTYLCVSDHTSGTFSTDLGNGLWMQIGGSGTSTSPSKLLSLTTSGTASAYTVTSGNSYASWGEVPPMLVEWDKINNASATLSVDGLSAKNLVIEGDNVNARDLQYKDLVVYDAGLDAAVVVGRSRTKQWLPATELLNDDTDAATQAAIGKVQTYQLAVNDIVWLPVRRMLGVDTLDITVHAVMTTAVSSVNAKLRAHVYELTDSNLADATADANASAEPSTPNSANDPFTFTIQLDVSTLADGSWISISLAREASSSPHSGDVAIFGVEVR